MGPLHREWHFTECKQSDQVRQLPNTWEIGCCQLGESREAQIHGSSGAVPQCRPPEHALCEDMDPPGHQHELEQRLVAYLATNTRLATRRSRGGGTEFIDHTSLTSCSAACPVERLNALSWTRNDGARACLRRLCVLPGNQSSQSTLQLQRSVRSTSSAGLSTRSGGLDTAWLMSRRALSWPNDLPEAFSLGTS